jgi:hypothetical protein
MRLCHIGQRAGSHTVMDSCNSLTAGSDPPTIREADVTRAVEGRRLPKIQQLNAFSEIAAARAVSKRGHGGRRPTMTFLGRSSVSKPLFAINLKRSARAGNIRGEGRLFSAILPF